MTFCVLSSISAGFSLLAALFNQRVSTCPNGQFSSRAHFSLRERPAPRRIPAVLITAFPNKANPTLAKGLAKKPFSLKPLLAVVSEYFPHQGAAWFCRGLLAAKLVRSSP